MIYVQISQTTAAPNIAQSCKHFLPNNSQLFLISKRVCTTVGHCHSTLIISDKARSLLLVFRTQWGPT